jgi:hypothetical protein
MPDSDQIKGKDGNGISDIAQITAWGLEAIETYVHHCHLFIYSVIPSFPIHPAIFHPENFCFQSSSICRMIIAKTYLNVKFQ